MKRLYRSRKTKVIAGVCGGIAEYFNVDPVLIRLIAVLLFFAGGAALLAYLIGIIIIPKEPPEVVIAGEGPVTLNAPAGTQQADNFGPTGSLIVGVILVALGAHFLLRRIPFFYPFYWRIWDMSWHYFWPSVLILLGVLVISRAVKK